MATIKQILNNVLAPKTNASGRAAGAALFNQQMGIGGGTGFKVTKPQVFPVGQGLTTTQTQQAYSAIKPASASNPKPSVASAGKIGPLPLGAVKPKDMAFVNPQTVNPKPVPTITYGSNTKTSSTPNGNTTSSYGSNTEVLGASYDNTSYRPMAFSAPAPMASSSFSAGGTTSIPSAKSAGGILGATAGELLGNAGYGYEKTPYEKQQEEAMRLQAEYYNKLANDQTTEESARNDALRLMQAEVDATNRIFADRLASQREVGNQRLAMDRAINFNAGGTGSSFANASQSRAMDVNLSDEAQIENQKLAALQAINSKAIQMGNQMFADKQNAKKLGVDAYLQAVNNQGALIEANTAKVATGMINSGINITTVPKEQLQSIASSLGTTPQRLIDTYNTVAKTVSVNKNIPASAQEYEYAKAQGYTGSFTDYQNEDANRKQAIAKAGVSNTSVGVSPQAQALAEQVAAGGMTIQQVPSALRAEVAQAMNSPILLQKKSSELDSYVSVVDELLNNPARRRITGPIDQRLGGMFGKAALAKNQYEQVKNIISLSGREKLKGTGTITDFEAKQLEKAGTAIDRNLSEKDFDAQLKKIRDILVSSRNRSVLPGGVADTNSISRVGGVVVNNNVGRTSQGGLSF